MTENRSGSAASSEGPVRRGSRWLASRSRAERVGLSVVASVIVLLVGVGGWLWWIRPLPTSVPLPEGVEEGRIVHMHSSIPPIRTEAGRLEAGPLRREQHHWVGAVRWIGADGADELVELRLGESAHIDGLGTVTLLAVNPDPLLPSTRDGGWTYNVNLLLDPGVEDCDQSRSACGDGRR